MILDVRSYPTGPRCWIAGQRVHHGATGLVVAAAALARKRTKLAAACLLLVAHDRRDWRVWFRREKLPASTLDHGSLGL